MISASNDLAARFSTFQEEAFRLETLDDYSNSGNPAAFRAFLAGETKPADYNAEWLETVRKATESGRIHTGRSTTQSVRKSAIPTRA